MDHPFLVVFALAALSALLKLGFRLRARRPRSGSPPSPAVQAGAGKWFARLGAGLRRRRGELHVRDGWVAFLPEGAHEPEWSLRAAELEVRRPGLTPRFSLRHPSIGEHHVEVTLGVPFGYEEASEKVTFNLRQGNDVVTILERWGARAY